MSKEMTLETAGKEVVFYDSNEVSIEGKLFKVSSNSHKRTENIAEDICKKLNTNFLELIDIKYSNLLSLHRVLYNEQY